MCGRLKKAHTRRGHRPESQGKVFEAASRARRGSPNTHFWAVETLSHSPGWTRDATGADSVCSLGRYAARFGVRCAVGEHPPVQHNEGGAAVGAGERRSGCEAARGAVARGQWHAVRLVRCRGGRVVR